MILTNSLNNGGKAILQDGFDTNRVSGPLTQFRQLSTILSSQTEIKAAQHSVQWTCGTRRAKSKHTTLRLVPSKRRCLVPSASG